MKESHSVLLISLVLLVSALCTVQTGGSGNPTRLKVDHSSYQLVPLDEITVTIEDQEYRSRYYATMGTISVNSFLTDADWLSWELSAPLNMNKTGNDGYWTFDQGTGADGSGNSNDGTLHGPTTVSGISAASRALSFDGDDYITIPHSPTLNISAEITVEAWIYPTFSNSGEHMIISKGGNWNTEDPQCYELTMDKDRPLFQMKLPDSEDWYGAAPADPISKNRWHHVAGVYDGTMFYIYIDGVNQTRIYDWGGDWKGITYQGGLPTSDHNISIGRREPASWGSLFYEGYIDEAAIWDRAIPPDEIRQHASIPGANCLDIYGTPDNGGVGDFDVIINITDGGGRYDQYRMSIVVQNIPPAITSSDVLEVDQGGNYSVQYTTDEIGGDITWTLDTSVEFLEMDPVTGLLSGIPTNSDVGKHLVNVSVNDGNDGSDSSIFQLDVIDVNDAPWIDTDDILVATEDQYFEVDYDGIDVDGEILTWYMETDAQWLHLDEAEGILNGTPTNDNVGNYTVNITASDPRGLTDSTEFVLQVINVNDAPTWTMVPENSTIDEGKVFSFELEALDVDIGDTISYEISSFPRADIIFNITTGYLEWNATREIFDTKDTNISFLAKAADGKETIKYFFHLELLLDPSPQTNLVFPVNGSRIINTTLLSWNIEDDDLNDVTYDLFLGEDLSSVLFRNPSTLLAENFNSTSIELTDLERGAMYYWMVIPKDRYSTGICQDGVFSFHVNSLPKANVISPETETVLPHGEVVMRCHGADPDGDNITYYWAIASNATDLASLDVSEMLEGGSEYTLMEYIPGETFFWVVIPADGLEIGDPTVPHSFKINNPPFLPDPGGSGGLKTVVGGSLTITIIGKDIDGDDMEFTLIDGPGRMILSQGEEGEDAKCTLKWTPAESDIGLTYVTVQLTDGLDSVNLTLEIEVEKVELNSSEKEDENGSAPVFMIIAISVLSIILVVVILLLILRRKEKATGEPIKEQRTSLQEEEDIPDFTATSQEVEDTVRQEEFPTNPLAGKGTVDHTEPVETHKISGPDAPTIDTEESNTTASSIASPVDGIQQSSSYDAKSPPPDIEETPSMDGSPDPQGAVPEPDRPSAQVLEKME